MSEASSAHTPAGSERPPGHAPSRLLRYTAALLAVAVALSVRLALDGLVGEEFQPYATTYVAVALIAWWVGLGPAIVTDKS